MKTETRDDIKQIFLASRHIYIHPQRFNLLQYLLDFSQCYCVTLICYAMLSYLVRWTHGCDEHPCKVCGADCLYHEAWLAQSDLR